MDEQHTVPGEHEVEPELDTTAPSPGIKTDDGEVVILEDIDNLDLPIVDPYAVEDAVIDRGE